MKDQINTIRAGLAIAIDSEVFIDKPVRRALLDAVKAAAQIEAAVGEPVAWINDDRKTISALELAHQPDWVRELWEDAAPLYVAPVAQQPHECTRSHPHENMDGFCVLRTEIARLTNENARLKAQQPQAEAVPIDNETKTMKLMGLVDDLIEADPDRAERFIETVLGRNALQKRLKQAQSKEPQAEAVPPGFEVWLRTVCFQRPTPEAYDLAKAAWRAAIAQQKGQP